MTRAAAVRRLGLLSPASASVLGAVVLVLVAASVPLAGLVRQLTLPGEAASVIPVLASAAVGVIVARHQPRNPVGWLLIFFTLLLMLSLDGGYYAVYCYRLGHPGLLFAPVAVLLVPLWAPAAGLFTLVILLFPDGKLAQRHWRWVLRLYAVLGACYLAFSYAGTIAAVAGHHIRLDSQGDVSSTQHFPAWMTIAVVIPIVAIWLSFAGHQVLSWRRATGERRQQLKWLASGAVVTFGVGIVGSTLVPGPAGQVLSVTIAALPLSIGVGILRYRLYEIDRLISRTLAYAIVTGLLIGVYAGLVLLITEVFRFRTPVAVAAATLAAVALFSPLRGRVQRLVDRRFNRARYDAEQTVAAFAARLQDATDLDSVRQDLAAVVHRTLEPAHVTVSVTRPTEPPRSSGQAAAPAHRELGLRRATSVVPSTPLTPQEVFSKSLCDSIPSIEGVITHNNDLRLSALSMGVPEGRTLGSRRRRAWWGKRDGASGAGARGGAGWWRCCGQICWEQRGGDFGVGVTQAGGHGE